MICSAPHKTAAKEVIFSQPPKLAFPTGASRFLRPQAATASTGPGGAPCTRGPGSGNGGSAKGLPAPSSPTPTSSLPRSPVSPSAPPGPLRPSPSLDVSLSRPPCALSAALARLPAHAPGLCLQPLQGDTGEREAVAGAGRDSPPPRPVRGYGGRRQRRRFRAAPPPLTAEIVSRFEFGARRLVSITCQPRPMRCTRGRGGPGQSAAAAGDTDVPVAREGLGPLG